MDDATLVGHFENIDRRLTKVEQILPTLATKQELAAAIAPLATKEELAAAVAPLATREEMRREIRVEGERSRRHSTVLFEHLDGKIQLLAEHVLSLMPKQPEG
jgi:hypothetical protein